MALAPGTKLGPYEVQSLLGAGGMGEVYRARDTRLQREVAIKVLPASLARDADRLRRFEQEAKSVAALNHPNLLTVFDVGTLPDPNASGADASPYIVSELLEGSTLRARLAEGAMGQRKVLDYGVQIASGLAAAHERGIIHRDIKPENIFITKDDRVKILDFGLAKLTQSEFDSQTSLPTATNETELGLVLGTMGYMSPEQLRGKKVDARSDIFSFGAVLYEMLSRRRAFHGDNTADVVSAILNQQPAELAVTNQEISPSARSHRSPLPGERSAAALPVGARSGLSAERHAGDAQFHRNCCGQSWRRRRNDRGHGCARSGRGGACASAGRNVVPGALYGSSGTA